MLSRVCSIGTLLLSLALLTPVAHAAETLSDILDDSEIARLLRVRTPTSPHIAPDGSVYLRDWPEGIYQLFRRAPGADVTEQGEQLTDFPDGISGFSVSPTGQDVLITASAGGSEQNDIYHYDVETGELTELYIDPKVVYSPNVWFNDGSAFVFSANDADPTSFHLYVHDLSSGGTFPIVQRDGYWFCTDVSQEGSKFVLGRYFSASESEVFVLDLESGEYIDITSRDPATGVAKQNLPIGFGPFETTLYYFNDITGQKKIYHYNFMRRQSRQTPIGGEGVELGGAMLSTDDQYLAVEVIRDGFVRPFVFKTGRHGPVRLPQIDKGVVSVQQFEGETLVYTLSNANNPSLSYRVEVGTGDDPEPVTAVFGEDADLERFDLPEVVYYPSFDRGIPAFLYLPEGAVDDGGNRTPVPFVVMYHGGPESQATPTFSAVRQGLVAEGYGVLVPNVRGSTGYGQEYQTLDNADKRWGAVRDGWAAGRWLVDEGYAEAGKIAAYGGSYGGFMATAVPIEDTRRAREGEGPFFGAAINIVGIVNFETFLENTGEYRRAVREAEYGSLDDRAMLAAISPINFVNDINLPMLIAHGLNDPRVPIGEAIQLATELQRRELDPEQVYFHDEGHGFAKLENRLHFYDRALRFLDREIGPGSGQ